MLIEEILKAVFVEKRKDIEAHPCSLITRRESKEAPKSNIELQLLAECDLEDEKSVLENHQAIQYMILH